MHARCRSFDLQLKDPFTISRGTVEVQPTLVVQLEHGQNIGLGEATTNPYYGETLESMRTALEEVEATIEDYELENPSVLWKELDPVLSQSRFAQCALDCAVWDVYAQSHGLPLWKLWGFHEDDQYPPSCFTIGLDTIDRMKEKIEENAGWPVYKVKLGAQGAVETVDALRQVTDATFRVDANCSWKAEEVLGLAEQLAERNVELIEQPLPADQYEQMKALKGQAAIPLMADESCQIESDVDRCLDSFDAINIKLVKCGGLSPARRMIARAKQRGLKVMVGCMTESSVGIAAGAHLLPLLDYADLDGALLLSKDIATGLRWENGFCQLPQSPGLGVELVE